MPTVIYFTRPSKKYPQKKVSIYARLTSGRKVDLTTKTGVEVLPNQFSNDTRTISQRSAYKDKMKDRKTLQDLEERILSEYKDLKKEPSKEWLTLVVDKFNYPDKYKKKPITLFSFIQEFIDKAPQRIIPKTGRPASYKTRRDYHKTFDDLKGFAATNEIDFEDVNKDLYDRFITYLTNKRTKKYPRGLAKNTIGKKIRVLKTFLNAATPKHLTSDQFKDFKSISEESESVYLNETELETIYNLDLKKEPRLEKVRDLFLIGCWTSLRFNDIAQVRPENIKNGKISINQGKTEKKVIIPLHSTVDAILKKYDNNLPRLISNQKFNDYLKEVAEKAEFDEMISKQMTIGGKRTTAFLPKWKRISAHTARRSFATNAYKMGVPSITIMAITGHRSETSFLKYIKVTLEEHAEKMKEIWLSNKK